MEKIVLEYSTSGLDGPWHPMVQAFSGRGYYFPGLLRKIDGSLTKRGNLRLGDVHIRHRAVPDIKAGMAWEEGKAASRIRFTVMGFGLPSLMRNGSTGIEWLVRMDTIKDGEVISTSYTTFRENAIMDSLKRHQG